MMRRDRSPTPESVDVRPSTSADSPAMLEVARALPQWFNAGGLEQMARDFSVQNGFVAEDAGAAGTPGAGLGGAGPSGAGPSGAGPSEAGPSGGVLGFVTYRPLSHEVALLTWIGVRPELRSRGLGRKLLEVLEGSLAAQGFARLEVETLAETADYPPYEETRRFYLAAGFKPKALVYERWGKGQDALVLAKDLGVKDLGHRPRRGEDVRFAVRVVAVGDGRPATGELCRAAHKVGQTFEFDWRTPEGLCGEAYAAMYPLLFALRVGGDMRGLGSSDRDVRVFTCPSRVVRFEVRAIRGRV